MTATLTENLNYATPAPITYRGARIVAKDYSTMIPDADIAGSGERSRMKKKHVSPSQLSMLFRCGEQYRRRYIEGEVIPPGFAAHRGTGVHAAADENNTQKIETHEDLPVDDLKDIAAEGFELRYKTDGVMLTPEERSRGMKIVKGEYKDQTVMLAELWGNEVAPTIQPILSEAKLTIELPDAPRDLLGILDTVTDDGTIIDLKTAGRKWPKNRANSELQFTFYGLAYRAVYKKDPRQIRADVLVAKSQPEYQPIITTRNQDDYKVLINRINTFLKIIETGAFTPASPGTWWCSKKWCGYAETCPYYSGREE